MALALGGRQAEREHRKAVIGGDRASASAALAALWVVSLALASPGGPVPSNAATLAEQQEKGGVVPPMRDAGEVAKYQGREVLVRFRPGVSKSQMDAVHARVGAEVVRSYSRVENLQLVRVPANLSVAEAIRRYRQSPEVLYAQPNYAVRALGGSVHPGGPSKQNAADSGHAEDARTH
jgi:hypothetical protein